MLAMEEDGGGTVTSGDCKDLYLGEFLHVLGYGGKEVTNEQLLDRR
jgi:hypothetical protein